MHTRISVPRWAVATALVAAVAATLLFSFNPRPPIAGASSAQTSGEPPPALRSDAQTIQRQLRGCANRKRIKHGLPTLAPAQPLEEAASLHAASMREDHFFDHIDKQGRDAADRVGIFGSKSRFLPIAENLGAGFERAKGACHAWMKSAGHRVNILNPDYNAIGSGYASGGDYGSYFVQVFGRQ